MPNAKNTQVPGNAPTDSLSEKSMCLRRLNLLFVLYNWFKGQAMQAAIAIKTRVTVLD